MMEINQQGIIMSKQHLNLSLYEFTEHAQAVMKNLGITYQKAVPQSLYDSWWFFNCENVPDPLPDGITLLKRQPHEYIGHGLSQEDADNIVANN